MATIESDLLHNAILNIEQKRWELEKQGKSRFEIINRQRNYFVGRLALTGLKIKE
jgi:hypothetical protein